MENRKMKMMRETREWIEARLAADIKRVWRKVNKTPPQRAAYAGRKLCGIEEGAEAIFRLLNGEEPCMICRYGSVELDTVTSAMAYDSISKRPLLRCMEKGYLFHNAGFFPKDVDQVLRFAQVMEEASYLADYVGVWFNPMEDYVISKFTRQDTQIGLLRSLEPWYAAKVRWTKALEGKKVLVIHPFAETIQKQYLNREKLFQDQDILPKFELLTQKAVQTAAAECDTRFQTWFEALEYMFEEAMSREFDVAILGCGAYGFPLAAKLKQAGKKAIHMGGSTQILFGIKGSRWDHHPVISTLYNEAWVRPGINETPKQASMVENACYW